MSTYTCRFLFYERDDTSHEPIFTINVEFHSKPSDKELFDMQFNLKSANKIDPGALCRTMLAKHGDDGEG